MFLALSKLVGGRTTLYLVGWFIAGIVFFALHRELASLTAFMVVHLGGAIGHSAKDDYFQGPPKP